MATMYSTIMLDPDTVPAKGYKVNYVNMTFGVYRNKGPAIRSNVLSPPA
jgi:hypothetical protein